MVSVRPHYITPFMKTLETPQFRDIRSVRIVDWHSDYSHDSEVNEAIKLGWELLLVQPGEFHSSFVLGWAMAGEPPQTERQKKSAEWLAAARRKMESQ